MFSKFSRIGAEPVKWQFTVHIVKLSLPSLKSASVVLSRGDSKVATSYAEPVKGYFTYPEPLTLTCTLYRKRDKGGHGVYLPKEGEVRVLERGKPKEAGVVAIDFSDYVSESRAEVESADNNWRIDKAADKYNNFMIVNITARRLGPAGAEEAGGAVDNAARKEEGKEADGDEEEDDEAEKEEGDWKKRNTLPANKGKPVAGKKQQWGDDDEDEEAADDDDDGEDEDEPLDDEDDAPPKKSAPSTANKAKPSKPPATARRDDDDDDQWSEDEDDIIRRLKGLKAEGKLVPGATRGGASGAAGKGGGKVEEKKGPVHVKGKPAGAKKDRSQMTAKEQLFADSDEDEEKDGEDDEEVKPKRGAAGKSAAAATKAPAAKEKEREEKAKGGQKVVSGPAAGRPAKSLNWEVVIPTASSSSGSITSPSSAQKSSAATPPVQPIPANRLFTCTLPEANTVYPPSLKAPPTVPYILTFLLQQLDKSNALLTPSLFKQYVDPTQTTALRTQLEQGAWKLRGPYAEDAHVLGGVLKGWVAGLLDGLVGEALVAEVLEVGKMEGEEDEDVKAAVKGVGSLMSPLHRASLVVLLQFLQAMTLPLNTRKNGMKAESLASAWGAAIVRMKADPKKSAYDQFQDKANVNRFVHFSIKHIDALKAATGPGQAATGGPAAGKAATPARQQQQQEEDEVEADGGDEEDEVLKDGEDEEGEEVDEGKGESDEEAAGLKFHADHGSEDDDENQKPKGKGKPLTARERLGQEKQERDKQKADKDKAERARLEKEKADKERADKSKADKAEREKQDRERKEKEERDRKEKDRKEKEDRDRKERERREKDEKEKKEREEKERKEKEKLAVGKKGVAVAAFKPANVFGDSDLDDDDEGEPVHDDDDDEQQDEDDEPERGEEEVKTIQPKTRSDLRASPPPAVTATSTTTGSNRADRELINRLQAELDSVRKQLTDSQARQFANKAPNSSADDISELKAKLVSALKEKDAAVKDKREADKKLTALEDERESQKKMVEKLQKMLVAKGKIDASQLSELSEAKRATSPAPPPPPPAGGGAGGKLSEHLSVMQLKYDAMAEEMEQKLATEKQIRKQLKQQLEQLTEENSNLRQRSMHFDQLVQTNPAATAAALSSPTASSPQQGKSKTKDELLAIVAQQYDRIAFLEHTMRENEGMMRQAKAAWADTARILEAEADGKDDELRRMRDGYEAAVGGKGVEWVGEEEWRKRVERLKRDKERLEREKKELEDEVRGKRVELQEAMKSMVQLEDDTRLLKEELTRTGIALKTIAEDNFELKEWMRLHSKGKKG